MTMKIKPKESVMQKKCSSLPPGDQLSANRQTAHTPPAPCPSFLLLSVTSWEMEYPWGL